MKVEPGLVFPTGERNGRLSGETLFSFSIRF